MLTLPFMMNGGGGISQIEYAPKTGTLIINGSLSADLIVDGYVNVSGSISSNVISSQTISYGSLSGNITEHANLEDGCDISVDNDGGTLTLTSGLTLNDGVLYVNGGYADIENGANVKFYKDLTIVDTGNSESYAVYSSNSTSSIESGCTVNLTGHFYTFSLHDSSNFNISGVLIINTTASTGYGIYLRDGSCMTVKSGGYIEVESPSEGIDIQTNTDEISFIIDNGATVKCTSNTSRAVRLTSDCNLTVNGTLITTSTEDYGLYCNGGTITVNGTIYVYGDCLINNSVTLSGNGKIYVNDEIYYDNGVRYFRGNENLTEI